MITGIIIAVFGVGLLIIGIYLLIRPTPPSKQRRQFIPRLIGGKIGAFLLICIGVFVFLGGTILIANPLPFLP
jgi:hypothetical protein